MDGWRIVGCVGSSNLIRLRSDRIKAILLVNGTTLRRLLFVVARQAEGAGAVLETHGLPGHHRPVR